MGRVSCLYSRTTFLTDRSLFLYRMGPNLWAALFLTCSMWGDQVAVYLRSPPDNDLFRPIRLVPRRMLLVGAGWSAVRHTRRLLQCSQRHSWRFSIQSTTVECRWGMTTGSWQAASACGALLWWPRRPLRGQTRRDGEGGACRWHTDWRGQDRSVHPSHPNQHASAKWRSRLEGRFENPIPEVGWDWVDYVRRDVEER